MWPELNTARLRDELMGPYAAVDVVPATGSTNADLFERATAADVPELCVLLAEEQLAGRGRGDSVWQAPARSSILASVLLKPAGIPLDHWPALTIVMASAVCQTLAEYGVHPLLKWPNDVVVVDPASAPIAGWERDRKIAGILAQALPARGGAEPGGIVVGVGVNVLQDVQDLAVPWASSLRVAQGPMGGYVDRTSVTISVLKRFAKRYSSWTQHEGLGNSLHEGYLDLIDGQLRVRTRDGGEHVGRIVRLDHRGGACVVLKDGKCVSLEPDKVAQVRHVGSTPIPGRSR